MVSATGTKSPGAMKNWIRKKKEEDILSVRVWPGDRLSDDERTGGARARGDRESFTPSRSDGEPNRPCWP